MRPLHVRCLFHNCSLFYAVVTMITLIAAVAKNRAIGYQNKLLYWLPDDMKRFRTLTTGHTIIMGRRTFESFPKGPLPNRRNVVLSHRDIQISGAEVFPSLEDALSSCDSDEDIYVLGGASVYEQALPLAHRLCLTEVEDTPDEADAFFPSFCVDEWEAEIVSEHHIDEKHTHPFRFVDYFRK